MHKKVLIKTPHGEVPGIAPLVISASRATDIPAFHTQWFMNKLRSGYCAWVNPFNRNQKTFISFSKCKAIVFWSKNPKPLIPYLDEISEKGIKYYFQYTVNDYSKEKLEPNVASLESKIETFIKLSEKIGNDKVIWRYDPIILTDSLSVEDIINRIDCIGKIISPYTKKLVFSFVDILNYSRVINNLKRLSINAREPTSDERIYIAKEISNISLEWKNKIEISTCAELDDLSKFGISHNKCIDDVLICKICKGDEEIIREYGKSPEQFSLMDAFKPKTESIKDKGQREQCLCAPSKDIGSYNTCLHLCAYCYANHSQPAVRNNFDRLSVESESLLE